MKEIETWRIKILLWPAVMTAAFLVFTVKIIWPKITETNKQLQIAEEIKQKTKSVTERINYLNSVDQKSLLKNESNVSAALMADKSPYWLVSLASKVGEALGYSTVSFMVSPGIVGAASAEGSGEPKESGPEEVKANLGLSGPKDKYIEILWTIENSLPIITITNFKMNASGDNAELELSLSANFLPKKQGTDLNKLSLKDLILEKKETELLDKLAGLKRIEGVEVASPSGERIRYDRINPFIL